MIRRDFKQTWELLRQNRTFSALYIAGTAVPLALTMLVVIWFHIRISPVYPELHRDNLYELKRVTWYHDTGSMSSGTCSLPLIRDWFYPLQSAEAVTAIYYRNWSPSYIRLPDGVSELAVRCKSTDPAFFRVFDFRFVDGGPFTEADLHNRRCCAVLAASTARRLFGTEQAAGRHFTMDYREYTVTGVVRDASTLTPLSFGQVYQPYSCLPDYEQMIRETERPTGAFTACFRTTGKEQARRMLADISNLVHRYNLSHAAEEDSLDLMGPLPVWKSNLIPGKKATALRPFMLLAGGLIALFLLVPALNLSGMIANRMEGRQAEMGICKAFGAGRNYLLRQVIHENLLLTLAGGALGLILSWSILALGSKWVFRMLDPFKFLQVDGVDILFTPSMLFSPRVFACAFLFCVVLNLASALIPAWKALRKPIVESLNQKK